ncbi:MAG: MBL fold metallo-hydrolase [Clostridia bacterium]|nr:MBL fold metallo-hydrolase [Clostridia bacterium]
MTKKEFFMEKYRQLADAYVQKHNDFFISPATQRIDPFKIADNLYYVGDKKVCIHLIDTGDGLILIDSGYLGATHLLVDNIWRAGFDPKNVRWIIHTHGHNDHFGASQEFRVMYGTKLAISRVDAEILKEKPHLFINKNKYPMAEVPTFDYEIEDGEIFEHGKVKIRCVLCPGHTDGVLSLFFDVTDNGKTYLAGTFGGAGTDAVTLPYIYRNERSEDAPQQLLNSIERIWNEPVEVHLGNHPYNNWTLEKRAKQIEEGGNPFIAPDSWHKFLGELKTKVEKVIAENEKLEQEFLALG